jgi:hypothetical protein
LLDHLLLIQAEADVSWCLEWMLTSEDESDLLMRIISTQLLALLQFLF